MNIKIYRASDFTRKIEYDPVEVEVVDLMDIANKYGHCDTGEVITVVDADTEAQDFSIELFGQLKGNSINY